jgi:hypothetical protein
VGEQKNGIKEKNYITVISGKITIFNMDHRYVA